MQPLLFCATVISTNPLQLFVQQFTKVTFTKTNIYIFQFVLCNPTAMYNAQTANLLLAFP